jgi:pyruvate/2-oxoglutarate dehydrogenase complex dihydrolipoamide acyltransferase (E2) component
VLEFAASDLVSAESRSMVQTVQLSGTLRPWREATVKAKVAGELQALSVREGDTVKSGQVIGRIDPTDYRARLAGSEADVAAAQEMVLDYIRSHVPSPKTAPLCGNSIATDRGFLARDMPELDEFLHYRMIDVSSIKELCRRWYPRIYYGQPEKGLAHRALADIQESIRELRYYRRTAFVPLPGPSTSEIADAVAELENGPENDSDTEADNG